MIAATYKRELSRQIEVLAEALRAVSSPDSHIRLQGRTDVRKAAHRLLRLDREWSDRYRQEQEQKRQREILEA